MTTLQKILNGLMARYTGRVPNVQKIIDCMIREGLVPDASAIENDHIAFRTMGVPHLGIQSLEKIFLAQGYTRRDPYRFEHKKLDAFWYSPPEDHYPRIFISELNVEDLSDETARLIRSYTDEVKSDPVDDLDLNDGEKVVSFLHQALWRTPTWKDYQLLANESEYASWVIYNRYYLNHFTVSVHNLPGEYSRLDSFNDFLEKNGFTLNDSGGKIKSSTDGMLLQSSTVAEMIQAEFTEESGGTQKHEISGSYIEFAQRCVLPQFKDLPEGKLTRQHRREGFEAANADKIFESTYSDQTSRVDPEGQ